MTRHVHVYLGLYRKRVADEVRSKYRVGQRVSWMVGNRKLTGKIARVDKTKEWGILYGIMVEGGEGTEAHGAYPSSVGTMVTIAERSIL